MTKWNRLSNLQFLFHLRPKKYPFSFSQKPKWQIWRLKQVMKSGLLPFLKISVKSDFLTKSNKSLQAIKLVSKHLKKFELKTILTSHYFSILYYSSEIWHIPSLSIKSKKMFSTSAKALLLCTKNYDHSILFDTLHTINNHATANQMIKYKLALMLYKIYNND